MELSKCETIRLLRFARTSSEVFLVTFTLECALDRIDTASACLPSTKPVTKVGQLAEMFGAAGTSTVHYLHAVGAKLNIVNCAHQRLLAREQVRQLISKYEILVLAPRCVAPRVIN